MEVLVTNLFTEVNGKIRGYSLIICELNPWLDNSYYHSKLERKLDTYIQVCSTHCFLSYH